MTLTALERAAWLLRTLDDARAGHKTPGEGIGPFMPKEWRTYYKHIEEALEHLRPLRPVQHNHCLARYRRRQLLTTELPIRRTRKGIEVILPPHHEHPRIIEQHGRVAKVRVYRWEPWVRQHKADEFLHDLVRRVGADRISLPPDLYLHATGQDTVPEPEAVAA